MGRAPISASAPDDEESTHKETDNPVTGEPDRFMGRDEYRKWVRASVSGHIWGRIVAIFSIIGFGAIIAIFTFLRSVTDDRINTRIDLKVLELQSVLDTELDKAEDDLATITLPKLVDTAVATEFAHQDELIEEITKQTVAQLQTSPEIEAVIKTIMVKQANLLLLDPMKRSLWESALHDILRFGDDHSKRIAISRILQDANSVGSEFALALQAYEIPDDNLDQRGELYGILRRAALVNSSFNDDSWKKLSTILKEGNFASDSLGWIKNVIENPNDDYEPAALRTIVAGIARADGFSPAEEFVQWLDSGSSDLRGLGWLGLKSMPQMMVADGPDVERRRELVRRAADSLARLSKEGASFPGAMYQALVPLLVPAAGANDWQALIAPQIVSAGPANWTRSDICVLLVNAWVARLRDEASHDPEIIDDVADLFRQAHKRRDQLLFSNSYENYKYLMSIASADVVTDYLLTAAEAIGPVGNPVDATEVAEELNASDISMLELKLNSQVFFRYVDELGSLDYLNVLRKALADKSKSPAQRSYWFATAAIAAGMSGSERNDRGKVFSGILAGYAGGDLSAEYASALLFVLTNAGYLQERSIVGAVENANLHLIEGAFGDAGGPSLVSDLTQQTAADIRATLKWVGALAGRSLGSLPVEVRDEVWLSFEAGPDEIQRVFVDPYPSRVLDYILVDVNDRVLTSGKSPEAGDNPGPLILEFSAAQGRHYLRLTLPPSEQATARLETTLFYRAGSFRYLGDAADHVKDIEAQSSVMVLTEGFDSAWFRFAAAAGKRYVLRAENLVADHSGGLIDTTIEVFGATEDDFIGADDDGGEEEGGERYSSFVTLPATDVDTTYHIRVENIDSGPGSFSFRVGEKI